MSTASKQALRAFRQLSREERFELGDALVHGYFDPHTYVDLIGEEPAPGFRLQLSRLWSFWEVESAQESFRLQLSRLGLEEDQP